MQAQHGEQQPEQQQAQRLFLQLAQTLLKDFQDDLPASPSRAFVTSLSPHPGSKLEDLGLALTMGALRFGYFYGAS